MSDTLRTNLDAFGCFEARSPESGCTDGKTNSKEDQCDDTGPESGANHLECKCGGRAHMLRVHWYC